MRLARVSSIAMLSVAAALAVASPAFGDDACEGYKWDVSRERALFDSSAVRAAAGKTAESALTVVPNRLYQLSLWPQGQVSLGTSGAKRAPADPAYAGLAVLRVPAAGKYRVAVDVPLWIDVLAQGNLVAVTDFEGIHACSAPRKIVEFDLNGGDSFVLQLSSSDRDTVRLTVSPSPSRKL